jgi:hypothetical protein
MTLTSTPLYQLPYLVTGQAQKEATHNQALIRIDALLQTSIEAELNTPPNSLTPAMAGKCWIIGASATDIWTGKEAQLAYWDGGGWQFIMPVHNMTFFNKATGRNITNKSGIWISNNVITDAIGGNIIDAEARIAVNQILAALKNAGILPS